MISGRDVENLQGEKIKTPDFNLKIVFHFYDYKSEWRRVQEKYFETELTGINGGTIIGQGGGWKWNGGHISFDGDYCWHNFITVCFDRSYFALIKTVGYVNTEDLDKGDFYDVASGEKVLSEERFEIKEINCSIRQFDPIPDNFMVEKSKIRMQLELKQLKMDPKRLNDFKKRLSQ